MGDSTAMTIDFLRARLLSERSVSRAARERADQLAKRVVELEEQLRIVTIQRKKAEKATVEVLDILESQGIGDLSDATDSTYDQDEGPGVVEGCEITSKGDEISTVSKVERSEVEDALSGSEIGASSAQAGSLSWKSHIGSPDSHRKQKSKHYRQRQRRSSFLFTSESSPKYQLGKSCRKIKRKDLQSTANVEGNKRELEVSKDESCSIDDQNAEADACYNTTGDEKDEEMKRVLEQQAQLIGQYEAEENAQKEWEKKYNETNSSTTGYFQIGNQPYLAENGFESKEAVELLCEKSCSEEEAKSSTENLSITKDPATEGPLNSVETPRRTSQENTNGSHEGALVVLSDGLAPTDAIMTPTGNNYHVMRDGLLDQKYSEIAIKQNASNLGKSNPSTKGSNDTSPQKHNRFPLYENSESGSSNNLDLHPSRHGILHTASMGRTLTDTSASKASTWGSSGFQNNAERHLQMQLYQTPSSSLGGVLEALQRAKISLREKLDKSPSPCQDTLAIAAQRESHALAKSTDTLNTPVGSSALFRLPTDSFPKAQFSVGAIHDSGLNLGHIKFANDSINHRRTTSLPVEAGNGLYIGRQNFDPQVSVMQMPPSSRYNPTSSDMMAMDRAHIPSGISKSYADLRNGMPDGDLFSFYGRDSTLSDKRML
ncbi:uncharacterized protein [Typha angustifolia]|uniref:uncharacterized protein n=1 Tax=Typha angustifolia TaxID=59011 RepID=UPI003C2CA96A